MKRIPVLSVGLLAALAVGGCRLDPPYDRPDADVRATWRDGSADVATLANVAWFDVYQDDVLRRLVQEAIVGSPDLGAALARIDEARALAQAVGADLYPRVDLSAHAGPLRSTRAQVPTGDRTAWTYGTSFDLSWELDFFGRIRSETAAARANYFRSVEAHRDVGIRLVAEVARAYFELRSLDERLAIASSTLESRKKYVDIAKARFEGGKTSEVGFRQAEGEYYRTEVVYVDAQRQIAAKEHEISVLLGHAPDAVARGRKAGDQPLPGTVPAGLPSDLLQRRPDIRVAEETLVSETALVGSARANLYPRIALTGAFGWESAQLSELFTNSSSTSSLIGSLLQPIFNAGRNRALVAAQCARMRVAMEGYRKTVLGAFREVEDGLSDYRRLGEQRGVQDRRVAALAKVLSLAETRYEGGVAEYLEVLDAQRELFDAQIEQVNTVQDHLVSLTLLYKALGGGWYCGEPWAQGAAPVQAAAPPMPPMQPVQPMPAVPPAAASPVPTPPAPPPR